MEQKEAVPQDILSNPLFAYFLFLAVGILFGRAHDVSVLILATGCWVCFLAFTKKDFAQCLVCVLFLLAGFSLIWIHDNKVTPSTDIYHFVSKKRVGVTFKVAATESERPYNTRYLVEMKSVNGKSATGYARWYAPQNIPVTLLPGDVLHLTNVKIKKPSSYRNIGGFDYDQYLKNRGITAIITTIKKTVVTHVETTFSWRRAFEKVKNSIKRTLSFDDKMVTAIARAMLIGDQGFISPEARTTFSRAGSAHLLAVSGLHVGFISATVYFAVKAFMFLVFYNTRYEWNSAGHPSRIAALIAIICVFTFAVMTGPGVSSARAAIMVATYLAAIFLGRGRDFYGAFAVAGIIILVCSPWSIFEAGFQLSFSAVFFIVLFMERWWKPVFKSNQQMFFKPPPGASVLQKMPYLGSFAAVSVFATIGSAPIAAYHFNVIPLYGVLLNTFLVPVASLAVPWGLFWTFATSAWAMQVTQTVMRFIWDMTKLTADAPFSHYHVGDISASSVAVYYLFILLFIFMKPLRIRKKLAVSVAIVFIVIVSMNPISSALNQNLKIMFLDVGQGDCTVIIWPKGGAMVIDAGGRYRTFDPGRSVIAPLLWSEQRTKLTALVVTHSDRDHMGGAMGLADLVPPDMLYDHGKISTKSSAYFRFLEIATRDGKYKALKAGDRIEFKGGLVMDVLSPSPDALGDNHNNNSLVIKLTYGKVKVLLTGDIESEVERALLDSGVDLSADIIKIAHHGSRSSSANEFLKRVGAKTAIISAGRNNSFGHPADETLHRLENANLKIYRTDIDGEVVMTTDGNTVEWTTYRENVR